MKKFRRDVLDSLISYQLYIYGLQGLFQGLMKHLKHYMFTYINGPRGDQSHKSPPIW